MIHASLSPDATDEALVVGARLRVPGAFESLVRRHNQRLYRIARAQLGTDDEAEEVTQQAWVQVYSALDQWAGRGTFSGWAASIVLNAGRQWRRQMSNISSNELDALETPTAGPDEITHRAQVRQIIERTVDALPAPLRTVYVMRDVEQMNGLEVAAVLEISESLVRVRLHRARRLLEASLEAEFEGETRALYSFLGSRCERLTSSVLGAVRGL